MKKCLLLIAILLLGAARAAAWQPPRLVGGLWVSCGVSDAQAQRLAGEYQAEKAAQEAEQAAWQRWRELQPPPGFPIWDSYNLFRFNPIWQQIRPGMGAGLYGGGALTWPSREQEIDNMLREWREGKLGRR